MFWLKMMTFLSGQTEAGLDTSGSEAKLQSVWTSVEEIVGDVMPFVYAALGIFLVIKGAMLGIQIVKAADEPQVRQEKIGALKWLVIGVAIAILVAVAADLLIGYFASLGGVNTDTGTPGINPTPSSMLF